MSIAQKVGIADSGSAIADDQRGADVAQEDEHDDDRERSALEQRLHGRIVVALGVVDRACRSC